jgi:hypothetical protein
MVNINTFIWHTATGISTAPNDHGIVGVIDGGGCNPQRALRRISPLPQISLK